MNAPLNAPSNPQEAERGATKITSALLQRWPLPQPEADGDKEQRGRLLIVAGCAEMPGAAILAANAALHAGAGKLTIATTAGVAPLVALAVPEARVIALPEAVNGAVAAPAAHAIDSLAEKFDALLIGPGMRDEPALAGFVAELLPRVAHAAVVLDACAMGIARANGNETGSAQGTGAAPAFLGRFAAPVLLTPHAGEMAHLCGCAKRQVLDDPAAAARAAAQRWQATVALKGAATCVATPDGRQWRHDGGNIGLAVSGSGDVLAGIIAGLAARGAPLEQAAAWGVALHAAAGARLAARIGPLGFLARDLAAEVPGLMRELAGAPWIEDSEGDK